jgi:NTE family protein
LSYGARRRRRTAASGAGERREVVVTAHRRPTRQPGDRIAVVLGAGGVLGAAWTAGALVALQRRLPCPIGEVGTIIGTSAGSVLAAALRCGVSADQIVEHQRGSGPIGLPDLSDLDRDAGGSLPRLPRLRPGSPRLVINTVRAPHRVHPWVAASAFVPEGRARHRSLSDLVHTLLALHPDGPPPAWPARGDTWIVAVDYDTGRRVAFGRAGAPNAALPDAVVASCSIPGWYEPKVIDGRRYIDGGVRSSTSADLLGRLDLDEVYVLAPMASYVTDNPRHPYARLERAFRRVITLALTRETRRIRASGATVTIVTPGPDDLGAIGVNLMDPNRRQRVLETSLRTSPAALDSRRRAA